MVFIVAQLARDSFPLCHTRVFAAAHTCGTVRVQRRLHYIPKQERTRTVKTDVRLAFKACKASLKPSLT